MAATLDMLRSPVDFAALQTGSRSRAHPLVVLRYRRNDRDITRYGISTGRRLGSAVVRNRIRRRLRTVLRALDRRVERGWDILIVARAPAATASQAQLREVLETLLRRAGMMEGQSVT